MKSNNVTNRASKGLVMNVMKEWLGLRLQGLELLAVVPHLCWNSLKMINHIQQAFSFKLKMLIIFHIIWLLRNKVRDDGIQFDGDNLVGNTFMQGCWMLRFQSNVFVNLERSRAENERFTLSQACSGFMLVLLMAVILQRMILLLEQQFILVHLVRLLSMQNMEKDRGRDKIEFIYAAVQKCWLE